MSIRSLLPFTQDATLIKPFHAMLVGVCVCVRACVFMPLAGLLYATAWSMRWYSDTGTWKMEGQFEFSSQH